MALADIAISKSEAVETPFSRGRHPAARWLPLLVVVLLSVAVAANVAALQTTSWLKTTAYPTLFNADGKVQTGVNGDVLTRVSASEICFSITNAMRPIRARDYCVAFHASDPAQSACTFVYSKAAIAKAKMHWDDDELVFLRLACGGVGNASILLQIGAIVTAGVAAVAISLVCCVRGRIHRLLCLVAVIASVLSALLATTTYIVWLTKLSTGDMHHGKSAVFTAGSVFLFAGAALASSSSSSKRDAAHNTETEEDDETKTTV